MSNGSGVEFFPQTLPARTVVANPRSQAGPAAAVAFAAFAADLADASTVTFTPGGTSAIARTVQGKLRERVSVLDFGTNTTPGTTDMLSAFTNAIASFGNTSVGGRIYVPGPGPYFLSDDLKISKQIWIEGDGGMYNTAPTQLLFANGKGIRVYHSTDSPDGNAGTGTIIDGFDVLAQAHSSATSGVRISAQLVTVRNCTVRSFGTHGISIGNAANGGAGNANVWSLDKVYLRDNLGSGLFVTGNDSNAGHARLVTSLSNGAWGIYDSSFLGNTYTACNTATNVSGGYKTDVATSRNLFDNCYSESDEPASSLVTPTIQLGGTFGNGFTTGSTHTSINPTSSGAIILGVAAAKIQFQNNTAVTGKTWEWNSFNDGHFYGGVSGVTNNVDISVNGIKIIGAYATSAPVTETNSTRVVLTTDAEIIANRAGTVTLTLLSAATYPGRVLRVRTIQNQTVVSDTSNVIPLIGGSAGTAILAGTAGKWADLKSDGSNWQIMAGN